eukprot:maker-scaffold180_size281610-snap-gene-0.35 protein:Tk11865 transcript:maker-scaffold180_size281610-snap-gene-0.35-mRNA-1 annotation:"hypothetical protein DAPPUDRAFT_303630"
MSEDEHRDYSDEESESEPDFCDPEGYVDDIPDDELLSDLLPNRPKESDDADSVVVVDGAPVVGSDRLPKLRSVMAKIFAQAGKVVNEHYPMDDEGKTKGYLFVEYANTNTAREAVRTLNNSRLDKLHVLTVNLLSDFDRVMAIPDEWEPPKEQEYKDQGNLKSWLLNTDAYDQFSIIYESGEKVAVCLNSKPEPIELEMRPRWTETYLKWSPMGTFLVTLHSRGIALWGGQDYHRVQKFSHVGVQYVDFSPCERYVITFAPHSPPTAAGEPTALIIWETRTGHQKRAFPAEGPPIWPIFKWSHDDKYFARMKGDCSLSIFETPSFGLLDKKSIKVPFMEDFSWSPAENIIAYWVAEDKDVPARVMLIEIPSKTEVRVKNLFNVADCKMHWQKSGDHLCVKVDRYSKLRKEKDDGPKYAGMYYNFEIFHMREKQIPVDSVEMKENVHAFAWEPIGYKFAIIHGEGQSLNVSFYGVKTGQTPALLKKYERKTANFLFWSPCGQFIVLAGLRTMNGALEFIDTADFTVMNGGDHFMCTDIEWDPTGRYLMTGVSWWGNKVDNGYWLWSFQGKILKRVQMDKFCQFLWRPRPPTLLDKKQIKEIKKNLKKYSVDFDAQDVLRSTKVSKELIDKRRAKYEKYEAYRAEKTEKFNSLREERIRLRGGVDTDILDTDKSEMEEEVVEFLVKEEETIE